MSRTDLDATTLASGLRMMAGDGSIEWVYEPIQASVLLDIADMLDENVKLKQELEAVGTAAYLYGRNDLSDENAKLRELCARMFKDFVSCDCELRARAGRTFMAFTRYALELQELGIEVGR